MTVLPIIIIMNSNKAETIQVAFEGEAAELICSFCHNGLCSPGHSHGSPQWSRIKSVIILLLCATAIALCGDLISNNIEPLLEKSGLSEVDCFFFLFFL